MRRPGRAHATLGPWCPRRAPISPFYETFFFASPHPKSAARVRAPRTAGAGRGGSGARGSAAGQRKCPRRPPPPLQPAPAPRPAATLAGRAPRATGGGGGRCGPGCPKEPTMPGRQNKRDPLRLLPGLSLTLSGAARDPGPTGAAPPGAPSHARPDLSPPTPSSPSPPPPPARTPASQAQGLPHPGTLGLLVPRDPAVLSPRRAARSSKIASGPRAPTHPAPGASRGRLGNRRQTPPPLPSGRRCAPGFSFLFFSNPDGKEGDRLLRIHQLSSQQQKSWRKGRPTGAIGGEGRRAITPSRASTPGRSAWTRGRGR